MSNANYVAKTFFLTLNAKTIGNMGLKADFGQIDTLKSDLEQAIRDISPNFYGAICESADGYKHCHLAISFEKSKRVQAVAKLLGNAHTEEMRGTKEEATAYVNKEGKFEEKGEKILAKFGYPDRIQDNSGERLNLDAIKELVLSGKLNASNIKNYVLNTGKTDFQQRSIENVYMRALNLLGDKERDVKVIYVEGKRGSGKTRGAYQRYKDIFKASVDERSNFPFNNYNGEKTLLLDELRPGVFSPAYLFQILDRYPLTLNVKGGCIPALWDTVVITTAMPLNEWFSDDNKGQDNNREQFRRRITEHYEAVGGEGEWKKKSDNSDFITLSDDDAKKVEALFGHLN